MTQINVRSAALGGCAGGKCRFKNAPGIGRHTRVCKRPSDQKTEQALIGVPIDVDARRCRGGDIGHVVNRTRLGSIRCARRGRLVRDIPGITQVQMPPENRTLAFLRVQMMHVPGEGRFRKSLGFERFVRVNPRDGPTPERSRQQAHRTQDRVRLAFFRPLRAKSITN